MDARTPPLPDSLVASCHGVPERMIWLEALPGVIRDLRERWSLSLERPWDGEEVSCAWVAPAIRDDGTLAVLKLGMPHLEGAHELDGLRFWDGQPTVRLIESDAGLNAMLLERCDPGTRLREVPEPEQDEVIASLLRRLWRKPPRSHPFRPLSVMTADRAQETRADRSRWIDAGLVRAGLDAMDELAVASSEDVLLATDLHAGNVLRAQREPWLAIDPKPFIGDRTFDATQHLLNCMARMSAAPIATIERFAGLLDVDPKRLRLWMFARSAAEPSAVLREDFVAIARVLG